MHVVVKKGVEVILVCLVRIPLTPEQKMQLSVPSYKQRKDKIKEISENIDKMKTSSVSVIGPASSDDHLESMDTYEPSHSVSTAPDSSEAQFNKSLWFRSLTS